MPEKEKPAKYQKRSLLFGIKYMFKKPVLRFYFFQNTGFMLNWGIKPILWPLIIFAMSQKNTITGSVFATMGIVAFIVLPFSGRFVDRKGFYKTTVLSMVLIGITGLVLVFTKQLWLFWIAAGIYAIGEALNGPMQGVLLTENIESKYRGEILGLDAVLDRTTQSLSPFIAGLFLTILAPQTVLLIYVIIIWLTLIIASVIYKKFIIKRSF